MRFSICLLLLLSANCFADRESYKKELEKRNQLRIQRRMHVAERRLQRLEYRKDRKHNYYWWRYY